MTNLVRNDSKTLQDLSGTKTKAFYSAYFSDSQSCLSEVTIIYCENKLFKDAVFWNYLWHENCLIHYTTLSSHIGKSIAMKIVSDEINFQYIN